MIKDIKLNDLSNKKVSIGNIEFAITGLEKYITKSGKESFTLLSLGSKFEGDIIGRTSDGFEVRCKGYIYAKKLVDKPEVEQVRAGKII